MTDGAILVVEDDLPLREAISAVLKDQGYAVLGVSTGTDALIALAQHPVTVVLLDLQLPGLTGWDVLDLMQAQDISVPVVVMSANLEQPRWAIEVPTAGRLRKPFDLDELLTTVARLCPA